MRLFASILLVLLVSRGGGQVTQEPARDVPVADEQPFTRTDDLQIPASVDEITVEARDLANGYGGKTVTIPVPQG